MVEENVALEETKVVRHDETAEKRNTERILKIFSVVLGIVGIIALIWIKTINPSFPFLSIFLIGASIIFISLLVFFAFTIYRKFTEKPDESKEYHGKLPKPASLVSLRLIAQNALCDEHFCNHTVGCVNEKFYHVGKYGERVYCYHTHALYRDEMKNGEVFILVNAHYPEDLRVILIDPTPMELKLIRESLASIPMEAKNEEVESSVFFNPITQAYQSTEKKSYKKAEEPKKSKEEDLQ